MQNALFCSMWVSRYMYTSGFFSAINVQYLLRPIHHMHKIAFYCLYFLNVLIFFSPRDNVVTANKEDNHHFPHHHHIIIIINIVIILIITTTISAPSSAAVAEKSFNYTYLQFLSFVSVFFLFTSTWVFFHPVPDSLDMS